MNSGIREELEIIARLSNKPNSIDAERHVVNRFYELLKEEESRKANAEKRNSENV